MRFNERLKELRNEKGVLQKEIAAHLGLTVKAYNFYELGQREPNIASICKLCDYFSVSADYLLCRTDNY